VDTAWVAALDELSNRSVVLFGGKGGVGKTTLSATAALHFSASRDTIVFTTDPASNIESLLAQTNRPDRLSVESFDADMLYKRFLDTNLDAFVELADRGTYLDRDEIRSLLQLALPGIDELMGWMRIGQIAEEHPDAILVVDTAPTGHTLRMLSSPAQFEALAGALESMQSKHRELVEQLSRRRFRDAMDDFIERFRDQARQRQELLQSKRSAFVPVILAEPWVVDQTVRLISEVKNDGIPIPFALLNRSSSSCDCRICRDRRSAEEKAEKDLAPIKVTAVPRYCGPLDNVEGLRGFLKGEIPKAPRAETLAESEPLTIPSRASIVFFAGKGGVGKTTSATSVVLQLAASSPESRFTLISVDPAHTVRDVFASQKPPDNLAVETIDTKAKWTRFRESLGKEIEEAIAALTPRGFTNRHDAAVMDQLIDMAPPGADELFAIMRLSELMSDQSQSMVVVDTAPTGHFLRLIDLPETAGAWVREFMRLLLKYRNIIPPGSLGEELVRASKALHNFTSTLRSGRSAAVLVTRAERTVTAETIRLRDELSRRGLQVSGIIANYLTPPSDCPCDLQMRSFEAATLSSLEAPLTIIDRREAPVTALDDLRKLVPLRHTADR